MKKLHNKIRVTELGDIASQLVKLYQKTENLQEDSFLKKTFSELESQGNSITEAVKKDKAVSHLEEADEKRDNAIRVLDKLLKGYENIPVDSLKPHGEKLSTIFKKYGVKIVDENYSSQSNLIDSLLIDFSAEEVKESISALTGVQEALSNIRTAQEDFETMRAEYNKAVSISESSASASSFRKPLLELINKKLIPYLLAMKMADNTKYSAFTNEFSQIIDTINETIKIRYKKKEN